MVDEPHNNDSDNEYQFKDDQDELNYQYEEQKAPPADGSGQRAAAVKGKRRPMLVIIGIIIAIFVIYKVIEVLFGGSAKVAEKKVTTTKTATVMRLEKPKPFAPTAAATATQTTATQATKPVGAISTAATMSSTDIKDAASLEAQSKQLAKKIEQQQFQNQANIMAMQESVKQMSDKFDQLLTTVNALVVATKASQKVEQQMRDAKVLQEKHKQAELRKMKAYFVDAIIPGRAWLKGKDGSTTTVAVGDVLPGYGKVIKINPFSGTVTTSHGILSYGAS